MKQVFTTGQVAKMCHVAPRTVSKWFDSGKLKGYRIPGSQDRRIPREQLLRFLKDNGMPVDRLVDDTTVIVLSNDEAIVSLAHKIAGTTYFVQEARNWFTAGSVCKMYVGSAALMILDACMGRDMAMNCLVAAKEMNKDLDVIVITPDDDGDVKVWMDAGAGEVVNRSADVAAVLEGAL